MEEKQSQWIKYGKKHYEESKAHKRAVERRKEKEEHKESGVRRCTKCDEIKNISLFPLNKNGTKCKRCLNEKTKEWNRKHPGVLDARRDRFERALYASKRMALKFGHQPCVATVSEIKKAFTGKCHICDRPEVECTKRLHLEHCHLTGKFRGWTCARCNMILGYVGDSSKLLESFIKYLRV